MKERDESLRDEPVSRVARASVLLLATVQLFRFRDPAYATDDAWISFRIARNWLEHGVPTFNATLPPVEGMTNLSWTALSTLWIALLPESDPIGPARLVGAACHLAALLVLMRAAARTAVRWGGTATLAAVGAGGLYAVCGSPAYYALSGLETPLWSLLFAVALDRASLLPERRPGVEIQLGLVAAALAATRPEGVLVGAGLVALPALLQRDVAGSLRAAAPFVVAVVAIQAFRVGVYGEWLPNTFHAKPPGSHGARYALTWLQALGWIGPLVALPALLRSRVVAWVLALAAVLAAGAVWSGGDWMPGFRRLTLPTLALAYAGGVSLALVAAPRRLVHLARVGALAWVIGALASAAAGHDRTLYYHKTLGLLGRLAGESDGIDRVALIDIGRFGWTFDGEILDLGGLVDAHIARLPGIHLAKRWDEDYFRRWSPELVLAVSETEVTDPLHGALRGRQPDTDVMRSMLFGGGYRFHTAVPASDATWILVFARDDVVLDPEAWGPPPPRSLRERVLEREAATRPPAGPAP